MSEQEKREDPQFTTDSVDDLEELLTRATNFADSYYSGTVAAEFADARDFVREELQDDEPELATDGGVDQSEAGADHPLAEEVPIKDDAEFGDLREFAEDTLKDGPVNVENLKLAKVELTFVSEDGNSAAYSAESEDYEADDYEEVR